MSSQPDRPTEPAAETTTPAHHEAASATPESNAPASSESPSEVTPNKGTAIRIGTQRYGVKPPTAVARPVLGSPNLNRAADSPNDAAEESTETAVSTAEQPASGTQPSEAAPATRPAKGAPRGHDSKKKSPQAPRFTSEPAPERKYPPPNIRSQLSPELEVELLEALGEQPLEEMLAGEAEKIVSDLEPESRHKAAVLAIHRDDVFLQLDGRQQGILSLRNLETVPEIGTILDVVVGRFNAADGFYEMTLPGGAVSVEDWSQVYEGMVVEARVTGHNKGGLECEVNRLRGFIPASQVSAYRVEDLSQFVGQAMNCVITEANPEKRNLVLSHRAVMEREKAEAKEKLMAELATGQLREGTVRSLQDFGAFVDLGGVDGLIHISQLSWDRIRHASEVLEVGQAVKVKVVKIDPQTGKIGLAFRDLSESPWATAAQDYPTRTRVPGKVSRLMDFGAFVRLGPGVEGLVHISELSHKRVFRVADVLQEGQEVEVMVLSVDAEQQRISLSLKALEARPTTEKPAPEVEEEVAPVVVPKKRQTPLKGGIGGPATGDKFGLRW